MRDAADNGREGTRELFNDPRKVPLPNPKFGDLVISRGWSLRQEKKPLTYQVLKGFQEDPESQECSRYSGTERKELPPDDIGFRVVIEPLR